MSLELTIPFETDEGYQYLICFREINSLPNNYNVPIVDLSIVLISLNVESNSYKTLNQFMEVISAYLSKNDVIIYYYCDVAPIKIRNSRKIKLSPQAFRFKLFSAMFSKKKLMRFICKKSS